MKIKKIGKKFVICILVLLIIFNFVIAPAGKINIVYADGEDDDTSETSGDTEDESTVESETNNALGKVLNGIAGILTWIPRAMMVASGAALQLVGYAVLDSAGDDGSTSVLTLTPFDIFFNKFTLTNINIFQTDDLQNANGTVDTTGLVYQLRSLVSALYYVFWLVAVAVLLIMLIIIGIKMAFSTLAEQKAKWKQIFVDWVVSALLVVCMSFIIVVIINLNNSFVEVLAGIAEGFGSDEIMSNLRSMALSASFIKGWAATIIYFLILLQTFIFGVVYIKRFFIVVFLIIISPLIPLAHSIDKAKGGHSNTLNSWLKEFCYNVCIQLIHCVIYIAIVAVPIKMLGSADVATWAGLAAAVLSILAMMSIRKIEDLLKSLLGFDKARSLTSYSSIVNAHNINESSMVKTAVSTATNVYGKGLSFGHDVLKNNTELGNFENKVSSKVSEVKTTATEKVTTGLERLRSGAVTGYRHVRQSENSNESSADNSNQLSSSEQSDNAVTAATSGGATGVDNASQQNANVSAQADASAQADSSALANALAQSGVTAVPVPIYGPDGRVMSTPERLVAGANTIVDPRGNPIIAANRDDLEDQLDDAKDELDDKLDEASDKLDELDDKLEEIDDKLDERTELKETLLSKYTETQKNFKEMNSYKSKKKSFESVRGFSLENANAILANAQKIGNKREAADYLYNEVEKADKSGNKSKFAEAEWALHEFEHGDSVEKFEKSKEAFEKYLYDSSLKANLISDEEREKLLKLGFDKSVDGKSEIEEIIKPRPVEKYKPSETDMLLASQASTGMFNMKYAYKNSQLLEEVNGDVQIEGELSEESIKKFNLKVLEKLHQGAYSESNFKEAEEKVRKEGDDAVKRVEAFKRKQTPRSAARLQTDAEKEYASLILESKQAGFIVNSARMNVESSSSASLVASGTSRESSAVISQINGDINTPIQLQDYAQRGNSANQANGNLDRPIQLYPNGQDRRKRA